jgi:RNA polymerase sigma-70 factor (ECF subfamily)
VYDRIGEPFRRERPTTGKDSMGPGPQLVLIRGAPAVRPEPPETSLEAVFRRYAPYVARIGLRLLGRHEEVDDLVQDVFVEAVKGLAQVRDPDALKGWLAAVTVRVASRRIRVKRIRRFLRLDQAPHYDRIEAPGATAEQRALLANVYNVLNDVDVDARAAWILRYVEGERLETIAATCGCSLATAKRRISAAQRRIDVALGMDGEDE